MAFAMVFDGPGLPLRKVFYDPPTPQGAEILVRVIMCALCRSDLHSHAGRRPQVTPAVLGHEILGRIVAFGPEASVRDARGQVCSVGDRVVWAIAVGCGRCFFCLKDLPQKCEHPFKYGHERVRDLPTQGGLTDYVLLVPNTVWYRVGEEIADAVAVSASCAVATVAGLVRQAGRIAGQVVVIFGGGVLGVTASAMAQAAGARAIIVSDPQPDCRSRAHRFGATQTARPEEVHEVVHHLTEGRGADVVLELAGSAHAVQSALALTRIGGKVLLAGTVAPVGGLAFDPELIVRRMLTIQGVHNYHPRDLEAALEFLAGPGRDYPFASLLGAEYPLGASEEALATAHARPGIRVMVCPSARGDAG